MANIAGGFARLGIDDAPLFAHLERTAIALKSSFTPQALLNPPTPHLRFKGSLWV